jgi:PTS system nitrogen regulatory IIA component
MPVDLDRILCPECSRHDLGATSKKRALEMASEVLSGQYPELDAGDLFDALMARERLGSTAVGEGVAIPHCRLAGCEQPMAALLHLQEPVEFDAPDGAPVDLLFVLVVPREENETHLKILATAAAALNDPDYRRALREASDDRTLHDLAVHPRSAAG